jgi:Flp pilus assembly protein TadD
MELQQQIDLLRDAALGTNFDEILAAVEAKILESHDLSLLAQLGEVLREKGLWQETETVLDRAMAWDPKATSLYQALALLFLRRDDLPEVDAYGRAKDLLVKCLKVEEAEDDLSPVTHTLLGKAYELLGNIDQARGEYERALDIDGHYTEARYNLAILVRDSEDSDKSFVTAQLMQCVLEDPKYFPALRDLGWQLVVAGQLSQAEGFLERARTIDDNDVSLHVYLGQLEWARQNLTDAEEHFRKAVSLEPTAPLTRRLLGRFLRFNGRPEDAGRELFSAIELDPTDLDSISAFREFLNELEDRESATNIYESSKAGSILSRTTLLELDKFIRQKSA